MANTTPLTYRIDPDIKIQGAAILKILGVSESTYIDMAYLVYHLIDDEKSEVSVVGVVLGRRDQIVQLKQMDFE